MKKTLALALAVVFVLAFAVPAFAQDMTHNATYKMDGTISLVKQVGHVCNTGAQMNQNIGGQGEMEKVMNTAQIQGRITVDDSNDFVTAEDAVNNLFVRSGVQLCAPGKHTASATERTYLAENWGPLTTHASHIDGQTVRDLGPNPVWLETDSWDYIPDATELYWNGFAGMNLAEQLLAWAQGLGSPQLEATVTALTTQREREIFIATHADDLPGLAAFLQYTEWGYTPLTNQIWAARVEANPGEVGQLSQDFEAAYGPFDGAGITATHAGFNDEWGFGTRAGYPWGFTRGVDYVGNYFNMDQFAYTSGGQTMRYINISSPFSHALVFEDMSVTGMAEIEDVFVMDNIRPGEAATPDWWDMFN